ncbi:MAG TPA: aminoglycoside 6'-N-acetyltransferase [Trinickia sp.]|nr:aminoglycoside 6'-N-acetyltransferase [Trinickia sp.]
MSPPSFTVRAVAQTDVSSWCSLRHRLWASTSADDHAREAEQLLAEPHRFATVIAVSPAGEAFGFAEAAIRHDYVNGCDTSPVSFLEGIYVVPAMRRRGIARALCTSIQEWARTYGCSEFASDSAIDNADAHALHRALGFEETERVVFFRKRC